MINLKTTILMKDITTQVSIAGIGFVFSGESYRTIRRYLDKIEAGYAANPDGREIVADIEARIAEIIMESQNGEQTVEAGLAEKIVSQLGYPDDMDPAAEDKVVDEVFPRRLYRNPEGSKIGGVCSGLAAYFNADPVWIRLGIFAPLILTPVFAAMGAEDAGEAMFALFGILCMLYFVLWFIVPKARSARQKLEMRGEKITARKIQLSFSEDLYEKAATEKGRRSASVWSEIIYIVGKILLFGLKCIAALTLFVLIVTFMGLMVSLFAIVFWPEHVHFLDFTYAELQGSSVHALAVMPVFVILVPVMILIYFIVRWLIGSKRPVNRRFLVISGTIWLLVTIFAAVIAFRNIEEFREKGSLEFMIFKKSGKERLDSEKYWNDNWVFDEQGRAHPKNAPVQEDTSSGGVWEDGLETEGSAADMEADQSEATEIRSETQSDSDEVNGGTAHAVRLPAAARSNGFSAQLNSAANIIMLLLRR